MPQAAYVASLLLMLGTLFVALTVFPMKRPGWLSFSFRPTRIDPMSEFEFNLQRYQGSWANGHLRSRSRCSAKSSKTSFTSA